jgi:hypothetical protein
MPERTAIQRKFVTIAEAAKFAGLSLSTVRSLLATSELTPFWPVPGRIVLDLDEVEAFIRKSRGKASTRGRRPYRRAGVRA